MIQTFNGSQNSGLYWSKWAFWYLAQFSQSRSLHFGWILDRFRCYNWCVLRGMFRARVVDDIARVGSSRNIFFFVKTCSISQSFHFLKITFGKNRRKNCPGRNHAGMESVGLRDFKLWALECPIHCCVNWDEKFLGESRWYQFYIFDTRNMKATSACSSESHDSENINILVIGLVVFASGPGLWGGVVSQFHLSDLSQ